MISFLLLCHAKSRRLIYSGHFLLLPTRLISLFNSLFNFLDHHYGLCAAANMHNGQGQANVGQSLKLARTGSIVLKPHEGESGVKIIFSDKNTGSTATLIAGQVKTLER